MTRRCSHCSHNGHNSRTCPTRGGPKLFGVRLMDGPMKKSASMGNLSSAHYLSSSSSPNPSSPSSDPLRDPNPALAQGYVSDDPAHASCSSNCRAERKKVAPYEGRVGCTEIGTICLYSGILLLLKCTLKVTGTPWTEEEHRRFLVGLQKLGKGDWRGIARNYVVSRTPTQVASHAQKYFIRQNNSGRRKRRSSLFDMVPDMSSDAHPVLEEQFGLTSSAAETEEINRLPSLSLALDRGCEPMESTLDSHPVEPEETIACSQLPPVVPAFIPAYVPVLYPFWPPNLPLAGEERKGTHQILRPIPVHSKNPANVDDLASMSKLSLGEAVAGRIEPSALSLELHGAPSRQSAFHANSTVGGSELSQNNSNIIHAV